MTSDLARSNRRDRRLAVGSAAHRLAELEQLLRCRAACPYYVKDEMKRWRSSSTTLAANGIRRKVRAWTHICHPKSGQEIARAVNANVTRVQLRMAGVDPVGSSPERLAEVLKSDLSQFAKVVKAARLTLQ